MLSSVFLVALLLVVAQARLVPQCSCTEAGVCESSIKQALEPCADSCQERLKLEEGEYEQLSACLASHRPLVDRTAACVRAELRESCAAGNQSSPTLLESRPADSLKLRLYQDFSQWLFRQQAGALVKDALLRNVPFFGCWRRCLQQRAGCLRRPACGLALPADEQLLLLGKRCALEAGLDQATVRQLCACFAHDVAPKLRSVCPRLTLG